MTARDGPRRTEPSLRRIRQSTHRRSPPARHRSLPARALVNAPWFDTVQFAVFTGALLWLTVTGGEQHGVQLAVVPGAPLHLPRHRRRDDLGAVDEGAGGHPGNHRLQRRPSPLPSDWSRPCWRLSNSFAGRIVAKVYLEVDPQHSPADPDLPLLLRPRPDRRLGSVLGRRCVSVGVRGGVRHAR